MSRFGLRSNSDSCKISEERFSRRKLCRSTLTKSINQLQQQHDRNESDLNHELDLNLEHIEGSTDCNLPSGDTDTSDDVAPPTTFICSFPLERINHIIEKLNIKNVKASPKISKAPSNDKCSDLLMDEDEDEIADSEKSLHTNLSKPANLMTKILCLYCDKKFSSHKMQVKHVEKFHCRQQDRRCSGRKLTGQPIEAIKRSKLNSDAQGFSGCMFCQKSKGHITYTGLSVTSSDLNALFNHLNDCHADKYFGCKVCVLRFQSIAKLKKHMQSVHENSIFDVANRSAETNTEIESLTNERVHLTIDNSKESSQRHQSVQNKITQKNTNAYCTTMSNTTTQNLNNIVSNTMAIRPEEPILSRLGLTQNRLPNNRKGIRLRRESMVFSDSLLKSDHNMGSNFGSPPAPISTSSPRLRNKVTKNTSVVASDSPSDNIFRIPIRTDILSCVFDDNFYKDVVTNVRNNLLFHLDGKIMGTSMSSLETAAMMQHIPQPQIRSTLVKSPIIVTTMDSEIHAATSLATVTAFPTLLTAEQYGADATSTKIRRLHTKNSWKWKWDSVKKYKVINEGGKVIKKMKHPLFGLRDLSKLDMWTQLVMRQKHELQQQQRKCKSIAQCDAQNNACRDEKRRLNDQLNLILDMRLLPHITLEQNEQATIKLENQENMDKTLTRNVKTCDSNMHHAYDERFLSMLNLLPITKNNRQTTQQLILSGEWARPRCYLCMCCGAKFEKIKLLEEHKMFRHSHIFSTHYEVVGRELLSGNLLQHLFIPKKALSRYTTNPDSNQGLSCSSRSVFCGKDDVSSHEATNQDESSDSVQSMVNSCVTHSISTKNNSCDDFDTDTKTTTVATPENINPIVSPVYSIQSSNSSAAYSKAHNSKHSSSNDHPSKGYNCSKCGRKCNGVLELYRHMLDCSGDYIWSMVKKRKYRYYCGSKKRRTYNKYNIQEIRKNKIKETKTSSVSNPINDEAISSNDRKVKTSPRPRPSDAESIKKMLENLPPKRVCKKIFPALNKTLKRSKHIQHNVFRNLRKTRMRQLSHATKILSKRKQFIKTKRALQSRRAHPVFKQEGTKTSTPEKKITSETMKRTSKRNLNKQLNVKENKSVSNNVKIERDCNEQNCVPGITENNNLTQPTVMKAILPPSVLAVPKVSTAGDAIKPMGSKNENEYSTSATDSSLVVANDQCNANFKTTSTSAFSTSAISKQEKVTQHNKNVKRSKRISDCIAMLTGKLEEKLKTEQKIETKQNEASIIPIESQLTATTMQNISGLVESDIRESRTKTFINENSEIIPTKRAPKRKTISRRFVKPITADNLTVNSNKAVPNIDKVSITNERSEHVNFVLPTLEQTVEDRSHLGVKIVTQTARPTAHMVKQNSANEGGFENKNGEFLLLTTSESQIPLRQSKIPSVLSACGLNVTPRTSLYATADKLNSASTLHPLSTVLPLSVSVAVQAPLTMTKTSQPLSDLKIFQKFQQPLCVNSGNFPALPLQAMNAHTSHLQTTSPICLPISDINPEPLNLSHTNKQKKNASRNSYNSQHSDNSGRQTCVGFSSDKATIYDSMEPLDLSKKYYSDTLKVQLKSTETIEKTGRYPVSTSVVQSSTSFLPINQSDIVVQKIITNSPVTTSPGDILIHNHFHSNLDLLRIPQIRYPLINLSTKSYDLLSTNSICGTTNNAIYNNNNNSTNISLPNKSTIKKRNNNNNNNSKLSCNVFNTTANSSVQFKSTSDTIFTSLSTTPTKNREISKTKDSGNRNKAVLKMDEKVINHIDDAINSVINAVKASLKDSEEIEKSKDLSTNANKINTLSPFMLNAVDIASNPSLSESKTLTPRKRNLRSKTLDCRPANLTKFNLLEATAAPAINHHPLFERNLKPYKKMETMKGIEVEINQPPDLPVTINKTNGKIAAIAHNEGNFIVDTVSLATIDNVTNVLPINKQSQHSIQSEDITKSFINKDIENSRIQSIEGTSCMVAHQSSAAQVSSNSTLTTLPTSIKAMTVTLKDSELSVKENDTVCAQKTFTETTSTLLELKQLNHINNNTSSGFHSSMQSDHLVNAVANSMQTEATTPVETTSETVAPIQQPTTTVTVVNSGSDISGDSKKKQRRRRKNELAAIVADQLLESFKLDKVRRDNLKKLENLAYEKNDDLLLTSMLLMSSTKRNVTTTSSNITREIAENANSNATASNKRCSKNSGTDTKTAETSKINHTDLLEIGIEDKTKPNTTCRQQSTQLPSDKISSRDSKKTAKNGKITSDIAKYRLYRRRGKTLDNENISKLKNSLESFSIDIERQLAEFESKNTNSSNKVIGSTTFNPINAQNISTTLTKPSIVLRPSILSITYDNQINQNNSVTVTQSSINNSEGNNKSCAISSRDPRLNKNIHKDEMCSNVLLSSTTHKKIDTTNNLDDIGDVDEDNYLTEIAKNVNEKIMSTENEEFAFKDDGFEMLNALDNDNSCSKFSRPPTSMSVRSAPNFNDDHSNFDSICDENTNIQALDMDIDDEMSVYTSYSQDLGRGRGRRRRRRRSVLLTRKPKKRNNKDVAAEKIECTLCRKTFYSANSLSKHNMTLAHVSKVSEQEYLQSKSVVNITQSHLPEQNHKPDTLGPYAKRPTRRATISEPPAKHQTTTTGSKASSFILEETPQTPLPFSKCNTRTTTVLTTPSCIEENEHIEATRVDPNIPAGGLNSYNNDSHLKLNADERLFFECCNILKGAETPHHSNFPINPTKCSSTLPNSNYLNLYTCSSEKLHNPQANSFSRESQNYRGTIKTSANKHIQTTPPRQSVTMSYNTPAVTPATVSDAVNAFRDPSQHLLNAGHNSFNKTINEGHIPHSPVCSAVSQLSSVTSITSRMKTKAAMKGYDTNNADFALYQQETKSRNICKLTELAEIALGNEEKPNNTEQGLQVRNDLFTIAAEPFQPSAMPMHAVHPPASVAVSVPHNVRTSGNIIPIDIYRRSERMKNNETRSSTSSKTIMHSSVIKAAVEEHQKSNTTSKSNRIIIPDRPFKNIGLDEKESITFQKPKIQAINLLNDDNSVSTASFSDRDDYDFGSLSCDDDVSQRDTMNQKILKNNTESSSSESSRATAKTFENKSLIMGRIFKNVTAKTSAKNASASSVKIRNIAVKEDIAHTPKADLNQLFDELRGNSVIEDRNQSSAKQNFSSNAVSGSVVTSQTHTQLSPTIAPSTNLTPYSCVNNDKCNNTNVDWNNAHVHKNQSNVEKKMLAESHAVSPPGVVSSTTVTPVVHARKYREARNKLKRGRNHSKDISKLQSELGMAPDEIKKLIDEGQRKSKRRCATSQPKKMVEMWSSDEYEEFLSTKDIIALIEEKEQQEKRKKSKTINNMNLSANTRDVINKEKGNSHVTSSTRENKKPAIKVQNDFNVKKRHSKNTHIQKLLNTLGFSRDETDAVNTNNQEAVSTTAATGFTKSQKTSRGSKTIKSNVNLGSSVLMGSSDRSNDKQAEKPITRNSNVEEYHALGKKRTARKSSARTHKDREADKNICIEYDISDNHDDDDDDDEEYENYFIANLEKNKSRSSNRVNKAVTSTTIVSSTANCGANSTNSSKEPKTTYSLSLKKRGRNESNAAYSNCIYQNKENNKQRLHSVMQEVPKQSTQVQNQKQQKKKRKRKLQTRQSPPRRKRTAGEKLYYWSSSSDDEFGLVGSNANNKDYVFTAPSTSIANNYDSSAEQYQKHGWIVGDSHKKLVTLLAITKGNKKVDSTCGVKKNVSRRRN